MTERMTLTLGSDGLLRDEQGSVRCRLIDLTVELGCRGSGGEEAKQQLPLTSTDAVSVEKNAYDGGSSTERADEVTRIWAHYQTVVPGGSRFMLEHKRKRIIANALKVRSLSKILLAIDGLAASPFHNGNNEQRKKYLGIQYALKGIGGEGNDERIDKMAAIASADPVDNIPSAVRDMVRTRQRQVEDMLLHPGDRNKRARAEGSVAYLEEAFGLTAIMDEGRVVWRKTGVVS